MVEKRENEIDTLKGIGILFVIASHCDANLRLFFSYPFSFTIPLFFWVAGYFLTNRTSFPVFVGKKIQSADAALLAVVRFKRRCFFYSNALA